MLRFEGINRDPDKSSILCYRREISGPSCSNLMILLIKVSLKFQTLISEFTQYFLLKKCEKLLHPFIFQPRILVYLPIAS